jgi:hypothetical protein
MTPIFGIGPKFLIFKTLQITKDWGWNEDNEQDWVPKKKWGTFNLGRSQNNYQKTKINITRGNRRQTSN